MREPYRDTFGREAPPEGLYIGNLRIGSVVTWGVGAPVKVVGQSAGCTRVMRKGFKQKRTVGTEEVVRRVPPQTFNVSKGTIVRRAR